MLIDDAIEAAKREGVLIPVRPVAWWAPEPRALLMCVPLKDEIERNRRDESERVRRRWAALEAAMMHFVEGGLMTEKIIKQLRPPKYEHWEILDRRPKPSLRVFGRFAKPDVFVATHVKERRGLGGMYSPQFEHEKLVCEEIWNNTGLPEPFRDAPHFRYDAYITENATPSVRVPK